jgi:hypothetical protein
VVQEVKIVKRIINTEYAREGREVKGSGVEIGTRKRGWNEKKRRKRALKRIVINGF